MELLKDGDIMLLKVYYPCDGRADQRWSGSRDAFSGNGQFEWDTVLHELSPTGTYPRPPRPNAYRQAFASVTSLLEQLERIVNLAVEVDLPTPVADALLEILYGMSPI